MQSILRRQSGGALPLPATSSSGGTMGNLKHVKNKLSRLPQSYPRVGSAMMVLATAGAAVQSNIPLLMGGVGLATVGATGVALHTTSEHLASINTAISTGVNEVSTMTHDSDGHAYIEQMEQSLQGVSRLLASIEQSRLVERLSGLDFDSLSSVLTKVGNADIEESFAKLTRIVEQFDKLTVSADLHFSTPTDNELGGASADNELASVGPAGATGLVTGVQSANVTA